MTVYGTSVPSSLTAVCRVTRTPEVSKRSGVEPSVSEEPSARSRTSDGGTIGPDTDSTASSGSGASPPASGSACRSSESTSIDTCSGSPSTGRRRHELAGSGPPPAGTSPVPDPVGAAPAPASAGAVPAPGPVGAAPAPEPAAAGPSPSGIANASSRDSVSSRIVRITRPRPNDTSSTVVDGVGENNTVGTGNRDGSASRADHGTTNTDPPG